MGVDCQSIRLPLVEKEIVECRPLLGALPLSLMCRGKVGLSTRRLPTSLSLAAMSHGVEEAGERALVPIVAHGQFSQFQSSAFQSESKSLNPWPVSTSTPPLMKVRSPWVWAQPLPDRISWGVACMLGGTQPLEHEIPIESAL